MDKTFVLEQRDKLSGAYHAVYRMEPADKRLGTAQIRLVTLNVVFRLEIYLELFLGKCLIHIVYELFTVKLYIMKLRAVKPIACFIAFVQTAASKPRTVKTALHIHPASVIRISSDP